MNLAFHCSPLRESAVKWLGNLEQAKMSALDLWIKPSVPSRRPELAPQGKLMSGQGAGHQSQAQQHCSSLRGHRVLAPKRGRGNAATQEGEGLQFELGALSTSSQ